MKDRFVFTRGMLLLIIFVILLIVGIIIGVNVSKSSSIEEYKTFESQLESIARNYYQMQELELEDGEERKITLSSLDKKIPVTNSLKNKCEAYVIVSNELNIENKEYEILYNAYINCGRKYTTNNYSEY